MGANDRQHRWELESSRKVQATSSGRRAKTTMGEVLSPAADEPPGAVGMMAGHNRKPKPRVPRQMKCLRCGRSLEDGFYVVVAHVGVFCRPCYEDNGGAVPPPRRPAK